VSQSTEARARATAEYRAANYAQAATTLAPLAAAESQDATALRLLGLCRLRLGDPTEALALLERAHHLAPGDPWTRFHLAIGLQAVGRHQEAAPLFRACEALLPDDPAPSINLATTRLALGDVAGAIRAARKAVLRAPSRPEAHYTLGQARLAAGQLPRAGDNFAAAARLAPRSPTPGSISAWCATGATTSPVPSQRCGPPSPPIRITTRPPAISAR
jgi:Flp pilus assembly protein TadD